MNRNKYPVLSRLARFHSCPPGSAASEHLFSTAKNVAWTKRLSLKSENLERLLFFKFNLPSMNGEKRTPTTEGGLQPKKTEKNRKKPVPNFKFAVAFGFFRFFFGIFRFFSVFFGFFRFFVVLFRFFSV